MKNYVCPSCKSALNSGACANCGFRVKRAGNIPVFFTASLVSKRYEEIGAFYDDLYENTDDVWSRVASRGRDFDQFVGSLIIAGKPWRLLDVGCGEGNLLTAVSATEKFGIDISHRALRAAASRAGAALCVGFAEELPYQTAFFNAITSIGVMTHFIDDIAATREINRVLHPEGRYIVGIFIRPTPAERVLNKISEFVYPRPRPDALFKWLFEKVSKTASGSHNAENNKARQPVERLYTVREVEKKFEACGFEISNVITKRKYPEAPLAGHHFRIYILRKKSDKAN